MGLDQLYPAADDGLADAGTYESLEVQAGVVGGRGTAGVGTEGGVRGGVEIDLRLSLGKAGEQVQEVLLMHKAGAKETIGAVHDPDRAGPREQGRAKRLEDQAFGEPPGSDPEGERRTQFPAGQAHPRESVFPAEAHEDGKHRRMDMGVKMPVHMGGLEPEGQEALELGLISFKAGRRSSAENTSARRGTGRKGRPREPSLKQTAEMKEDRRIRPHASR